MSVLPRLCFSLVLLAPALVHAATLENPRNGSFYSGIGVISGWKCTATGPLTVRFNGGDAIPLAYGNERGDVRNAGACSSAQVGFVSIMNWAELGDGTHTAVAYDNGVEFARSTFTVATTGEPFVTGAEGECRVPDFPAPGEAMAFAWNEATQHLEMTGDSDSGSGGDDHGNTAREATPVAVASATPGRIEPASDEDWFRVQVSSTGFLRLYPVGGGTWVELYRGEAVRKIVSWSEDRNAAVRLHYNGRDNQGNYFAHYRVVPDVYYAVVRGGATGPYQFEIRWTSTFQPGEDRHDPPAQPARATAAAAVGQGVLENPRNGSFYSGIGVISGWKCTANGPLTVRFNSGNPIPLAYGNVRADVRNAGACRSVQVGFVSIMNWAELGDGTHTAVAYDNGVEFARSTFTVATTGEPFVTGAEGECRVPDFPALGESMPFAWNEATQHLEMVAESDSAGNDASGVPRNVQVTEVGEDFVVVDWDPPTGGRAVSYNVYYRGPNEPEYLLGNVTTLGTRVSGTVVPGECYRVTAVNAAGVEGEKSPEVCVQTQQPPDGGGGSGGEGDRGGVCDRTPQVRAAIVAALGSGCESITDRQLGSIKSLEVTNSTTRDSIIRCKPAVLPLTALKPGDFAGLSNLVVLTLRCNQLTTLPPDVFAGLSNLNGLFLDHNQLTTLPPDVFAGLSNLGFLNLRHNQLTTLPPDVFAGLSNLVGLSLDHNQLTTLSPDVFAGLSNLTHLDLSYNQLAALPPDVFADLPDGARIILVENPGYPFSTGGGGDGGDGGDGGSGALCGQDPVAVCTDIWTGDPRDEQSKAICQSACAYAAACHDEGVRFNCANLRRLDEINNTNYGIRNCPVCQ